MTDESTLHAPPEALDALEEIVTKNRPSAIGALIYTTLCRVFDKQDDKRREYLNELAEFFRLLAQTKMLICIMTSPDRLCS
jgi:uncharacterized membrane protein YebE (DUF533 family)